MYSWDGDTGGWYGRTKYRYGDKGKKCDSDDADTCANGDYACDAAGHLSCANDVAGNGTEAARRTVGIAGAGRFSFLDLQQ